MRSEGKRRRRNKFEHELDLLQNELRESLIGITGQQRLEVIRAWRNQNAENKLVGYAVVNHALLMLEKEDSAISHRDSTPQNQSLTIVQNHGSINSFAGGVGSSTVIESTSSVPSQAYFFKSKIELSKSLASVYPAIVSCLVSLQMWIWPIPVIHTAKLTIAQNLSLFLLVAGIFYVVIMIIQSYIKNWEKRTLYGAAFVFAGSSMLKMLVPLIAFGFYSSDGVTTKKMGGFLEFVETGTPPVSFSIVLAAICIVLGFLTDRLQFLFANRVPSE
jgi:hypothetical protein